MLEKTARMLILTRCPVLRFTVLKQANTTPTCVMGRRSRVTLASCLPLAMLHVLELWYGRCKSPIRRGSNCFEEGFRLMPEKHPYFARFVPGANVPSSLWPVTASTLRFSVQMHLDALNLSGASDDTVMRLDKELELSLSDAGRLLGLWGGTLSLQPWKCQNCGPALMPHVRVCSSCRQQREISRFILSGHCKFDAHCRSVHTKADDVFLCRNRRLVLDANSSTSESESINTQFFDCQWRRPCSTRPWKRP